MDDNSFPNQYVVSAHLSDSLILVADCPVDSNFAYPSLKYDLSDHKSILEGAMSFLNPFSEYKDLKLGSSSDILIRWSSDWP